MSYDTWDWQNAENNSHIIFDVNMDFTWKVTVVSNGSKTEAPVAITYPIIVSKDSVRLSFLIAALNYLYVMSFDIGKCISQCTMQR